MPNRPDPLTASQPDGRRLAGTIIHRAAAQSEDDPFEFVMATDDVDRMGDVIDIDGIDLDAFSANPIALYQHNFSQPIGTWQNLRRSAGRLVGQLVLAAQGTSAVVDEVRRFLEQRILKTCSVGFRVIEANPIKGTFGVHFTRSELLECSVVPIPANANAVRIKALFPAAPSYLFSDNLIPGSQSPNGSIQRTGAAAPTPRRQLAIPAREPPKMRTIAERITAHLARTAAIDEELNTILVGAANDNDREFTDDETVRIDALSAEKLSLVDNIKSLQTAEAALAANARPAGAPRPALIEARAAIVEPRAAIIGKMAAVTALAALRKVPPEQIISQRYASDDRVAACFHMIQRTATNIADTTTPTWAAELVQQGFGAFVDDLTVDSIFAMLRARASTTTVNLDGVGKLSIPMFANNDDLGGAWVGEGGVIPVLQGHLIAAVMEMTKLAGITTCTKELVNASNENVEAILLSGMRMSTSKMLDKALLDAGAKVAGVRPAGLQVGAHTAASGGPDAVAADMLAALAPIQAAGGGTDIVLIMNPAQLSGLEWQQNLMGMPQFPEAAQKRLGSYPILASTNVPVGTVIMLDAAFYMDAAGTPEFEASEHTTLTMANADGTAPTQAITPAGTIGTPGQVIPDGGIKVSGGPVGAGTANIIAMSMFQQYSVALRLVVPVYWLMRRAGMVSVITGVAWGTAP